MSAGDAVLDLAYLRQTVGIVGYLLPSHCEQLFTEIDRLQAQLAAQQAVVDAARGALNCIYDDDPVGFHWSGGGCLDVLDRALAALDAAQATQPEGERA